MNSLLFYNTKHEQNFWQRLKECTKLQKSKITSCKITTAHKNNKIAYRYRNTI